MDRRTFLAATGVALCAPLVGCRGATTTPENDPAPGTTAADPPTNTDEDPPVTDATEADPSGRPWPPSDPIEDSDGVHHLYVENYTETTETAWIRVVRESGATLVDGRYELPDGRGIKFTNIASWETNYTIDLAIDGEDVTSLAWDTEACGSGSEVPGDNGSRNAAVRVKNTADDTIDNRVSLVVDQCDALFAPGVPIGPAETFRVDE